VVFNQSEAEQQNRSFLESEYPDNPFNAKIIRNGPNSEKYEKNENENYP